ncbi:hypothetical protein BDV25DRAFT_143573 [Aspergillus avenaceus]|uniref:Uncharacterized protein n=1 Tax=Aspergillus avenaceus TaxID=36643 RepID=A0A5N6TJP2_ASPAV|nr:hypothetical protein BDV25DRAFT_143573 [Aspergillus avenaceus]
MSIDDNFQNPQDPLYVSSSMSATSYLANLRLFSVAVISIFAPIDSNPDSSTLDPLAVLVFVYTTVSSSKQGLFRLLRWSRSRILALALSVLTALLRSFSITKGLLGVLESRLEESLYLAGGKYTVAGIASIPRVFQDEDILEFGLNQWPMPRADYGAKRYTYAYAGGTRGTIWTVVSERESCKGLKIRTAFL